VAALPEDVVRAHVADEMSAAGAWAARQHHELAFDADALTLRLPLLGKQPAAGAAERYLLTGAFDGYRAVPPAWRFVHPDTGEDIGQAGYPANDGGEPTSIFLAHERGVICAHFNRLAFAKHSGPHGDWGDETNWLNAASGYTRAETIADMLARIELGVRSSTARMAPLP
jgi:hypothetical protein